MQDVDPLERYGTGGGDSFHLFHCQQVAVVVIVWELECHRKTEKSRTRCRGAVASRFSIAAEVVSFPSDLDSVSFFNIEISPKSATPFR